MWGYISSQEEYILQFHISAFGIGQEQEVGQKWAEIRIISIL